MSVEWYIYIYRLMFELWVASACGHLCTTRTRAKIHQTKLAVCSAVDISFNCMGSVPLECAFMRICGSWSWMWIVLRERSMILHKWGYTQHDERESSSVFSQEDEIKLLAVGIMWMSYIFLRVENIKILLHICVSIQNDLLNWYLSVSRTSGRWSPLHGSWLQNAVALKFLHAFNRKCCLILFTLTGIEMERQWRSVKL